MNMPDVPPPSSRFGPAPSAVAPGALAWVERLLPLVSTLRGYGSEQARRDLVAGLTTALFAVPQGMAYALIAGFPPSAGIATSAVAAVLGAAFGSSEFLINGPTNAISVMIAGNAALFAAHGDPVRAIVLLTLMIGVAQTLAGVLRVGSLIRFVSESVLTGFTAGAGVYIVVNQLPSFFGMPKSAIAGDLWGFVPPKCAVFDLLRLIRSMHGVHLPTFGLATLTFLLVRGLQRLEPRVGRRLPAPFFAVVAVTSVSYLLGFDAADHPEHVRTVRDIEPLTRALPSLKWPSLVVPSIRALLEPAFAIGLMGAVEAIAIGKTLATKAGHRFDASRQLIGEGLCNVGAAFVGGFASSGSFSRTAVNFEAGAVTRVSCILSGGLTLLIVALFAPLANHIPLSALSGTLVHIGLKLVDVGRLRVLFMTTPGDRAVLLTTFAAVLLGEHLEHALFIGIGVSVFYALRRAEGFKLQALEEDGAGLLRETPRAPRPDGSVTLLNLQGELFFAAAEELQQELLKEVDHPRRVVVLRVQEAYNLDATSAEAIAHAAERAMARGGRLILCGVRPGMFGTFERAGLLAKLGAENLFRAEPEFLASTRRAIAFAHALVAADRDQATPAARAG